MLIDNFLIDSFGAVYIPRFESSSYKYWMSKLAFRAGECVAPSVSVVVHGGEDFAMDKENNILYIPREFSELRQCYLLRVVIDYMEVSRKFLPLHAAAVSNNDIQVFIFAKSRGGKSTVSHMLCESCPDYFIVGDDHIILNDTYIFGNGYMRLRTTDENDSCYAENRVFDVRRPSLTVCYEYSQTEQICREIKCGENFPAMLRSLNAHKYLLDSFIMDNISYSAVKMWGNGIIEEYLSLTERFIAGTKAVHIIGDYSYVAEKIRSITS